MIYTCTLNPSVDYIIHVAEAELGGLNRGEQVFYYPGGKGINVSRVLNRLQVENTALGFIGGFTGDFIHNELSKENIRTDFISVNDVTRINMKLKSREETEINGPGAEVSSDQLNQLFDKIQSFKPGDTLVASGSIPKSIPSNFYSQLASICAENGVNIIVDTSSSALKDIVGNELFLIKPNHHELGELFDVTISTHKDAVYYGKKLVEQGAKHVIVSMGGEGAVYVSAERELIAEAPKGTVKNTVGAGDSLVSGFIASFSMEQDPEKAFQFAVATGSATAFSEDLCEKEDVEALLDQVKVNKW